MPKSRVRKKKVYTPPAEVRPTSQASAKKPSPLWLPVTAVALILLGIGWLVAFYLTGGFLDLTNHDPNPLSKLGYWNLAIGFGGLIGSLLLLSRWR